MSDGAENAAEVGSQSLEAGVAGGCESSEVNGASEREMWGNGGSDRAVEVESGGRIAGCVVWVASAAALYDENVAANVEGG